MELKKRKFEVRITVEAECETVKQGIEDVRKYMSVLKLKVEDIKSISNRRTDQQNRALHLWFTMLAEELNAAGYDMKKVVRANVDIPWTSYNVKEFLWRPVQESQLGKKSTTQLSTDEIDKIYDTINRVVGERTGVHVPFPSLDGLIDRDSQ